MDDKPPNLPNKSEDFNDELFGYVSVSSEERNSKEGNDADTEEVEYSSPGKLVICENEESFEENDKTVDDLDPKDPVGEEFPVATEDIQEQSEGDNTVDDSIQVETREEKEETAIKTAAPEPINFDMPSYGTKYPCHKCSCFYWNYRSYQIHKKKYEKVKPWIPFICAFCPETFSSKKELKKHEKESHDEDIQDDGDEGSTSSKEEQKPTKRARIVAKFQCSDCPLTFNVKSGLTAHQYEAHRDTSAVNETDKEKTHKRLCGFIECQKCGKDYKSLASLAKHLSSCQSVSCDSCGDKFNSQKDLILHKKNCGVDIKKIPRVKKTVKRSASVTGDIPVPESFAAPPAKRMFIVKKEAEKVMPKEKVLPAKTQSTEARVFKSNLPLTADIFAKKEQDPKEFMVIWTESLDTDLIDAVQINSSNAILCIQNLDVLNLSENQKEAFKKSDMFTFNLSSSNDSYILWTVISFGNKPERIQNKLFMQFYEVEQKFAEHAEKLGMVINNIMRESGLFPILVKNLHHNITVFNARL